MRVAVIGSRGVQIKNLAPYLPEETSEIVTGGAQGADSSAETYAREKSIPCTLFQPDYRRYGRAAPLRRNDEIIAYSDMVLAFWDGSSRGTAYVIRQCKRHGKSLRVYLPAGENGWTLHAEMKSEK